MVQEPRKHMCHTELEYLLFKLPLKKTKDFYLFPYLRERERALAGKGAEGEGQVDSWLSVSPTGNSVPGL